MPDVGLHPIIPSPNTPMKQHSPCLALRPVSLAAACALLAALFLACPVRGLAAVEHPAPETESAQAQTPQERWQIKADKLSAEHDTEILEAEGKVHLWQGDQYMKADFARYYRTTGWVYLRGHVEAKLGNDLMQGEEAEFDLKNKTGWLKNGEIFTARQHLYFKGEHIEKHRGDTYTFKNGSVTACDGETKAWSVDMVEGEVTLEGYAWLWHPMLKAGGTPNLLLPPGNPACQKQAPKWPAHAGMGNQLAPGHLLYPAPTSGPSTTNPTPPSISTICPSAATSRVWSTVPPRTPRPRACGASTS